MSQRLTIGFGIATTLFASTIGALAPQAVAQELAPGVSCERFTCRNDTDDAYRVEATAQCEDGVSVPVTKHLAPHLQAAHVGVGCPFTVEPGTWEEQPPTLGPGTWEQQPPVQRPDGSWEQRPPVFKPGTWERQPPIFRPGRTIQNSVVKIVYHRAVIDNDPVREPSGSAGL